MIQPASDSELALMRIIWSAGGQAQYAYIMEELAQSGRPWQKNTVITLLSRLVEKGLLLRGSGPEGAMTYQLRDSRHRHYLICTRCGSSVPIPGCPLEGLEQSLGAKTGFAITGHNLELYGLCPQCAKGDKA